MMMLFDCLAELKKNKEKERKKRNKTNPDDNKQL